jgi:hypothetical protein
MDVGGCCLPPLIAPPPLSGPLSFITKTLRFAASSELTVPERDSSLPASSSLTNAVVFRRQHLLPIFVAASTSARIICYRFTISSGYQIETRRTPASSAHFPFVWLDLFDRLAATRLRLATCRLQCADRQLRLMVRRLCLSDLFFASSVHLVL